MSADVTRSEQIKAYFDSDWAAPYPNRTDLAMLLKRQPSMAIPDPDEFYKAYQWLSVAERSWHSSGKHTWMPAAMLARAAGLSEAATIAAAYIGFRVSGTKIKFPPINAGSANDRTHRGRTSFACKGDKQ